jgi:hypothetical protein
MILVLNQNTKNLILLILSGTNLSLLGRNVKTPVNMVQVLVNPWVVRGLGGAYLCIP